MAFRTRAFGASQVFYSFVLCILLLFPAFPALSSVSAGEWNTFHGDSARTGFMDSPEIRGDIRWERDIQNGYIDTSPVFGDGGVFVLTAGKNGTQSAVHRLDAATGNLSWSTSIPGKTYQLSTPVYSAGRLYFGSSSGILYCLNADNGNIVWQAALDASPNGFTSSPALNASSGDLYIASGTGILYNLNPENGQIKWQFNTGRGIYFSSPTIYGRTVFIGNDNGVLYAVQDGSELWHYTAGDRIRSSASISENGTIFFACEDGRLYSLDLSGKLNWEYKIGVSKSTPAIWKNIVTVGSENGLYAFSPNSSLLFRIPTSGPVDSSPALTKTQVFFTTNSANGELFSADLSGNILWSMPLHEHALSSPGLSGEGELLVASDSGKIWSIFTTTPSSLILHFHPVPEQNEGTVNLNITGEILYDSGRPAAGAKVEAVLEGHSASTNAGPNGSFSINLTLSLKAGNYTAILSGTDGRLSVEETVNLTVLPEKKGTNDNGVVFLSLPQVVFGVFLIAVLRGWKGNRK